MICRLLHKFVKVFANPQFCSGMRDSSPKVHPDFILKNALFLFQPHTDIELNNLGSKYTVFASLVLLIPSPPLDRF